MKQRIALFAGSFDPFTKGHEDVVRRALPLFDKIIIGIGENSQKKRFFALDFMIDKIKTCFATESKVEVCSYKGLTVKYALSRNAHFLLRGLRNGDDLNYEFPISQANRELNPQLETIFMLTSAHYAYISSTIVRELHKHGEDVSRFLPYTLA
ncbi:MAG: pantetheine-phosphate adenylyltransferase [Bernardetiaceae bacterium]|nr:pantetheine-phosphate adenylyltransferase [Bernardetiaceae bacterium]